jgi:hypothetical protein
VQQCSSAGLNDGAAVQQGLVAMEQDQEQEQTQLTDDERQD